MTSGAVLMWIGALAWSQTTTVEDSPTMAELREALDSTPLDKLGESPLANRPLTRAEASRAAALLWEAFQRQERETRAQELAEGKVSAGGTTMRFFQVTRGERPERGHSLWISLHGGGGTAAAVNDQQWRNQQRLYAPEEGVYVAPRAPGNTWDLWHQAHIDPLFDRLISDFVIAGEVDPDRVYLLGYSAGGDGVYQVAPRMADRFAAAAMMAGHPNETRPDGLLNLPFTLHVGGRDSAYRRNAIAAEWQELLAGLAESERTAGRPGGYPHWVKVHEGKGHWMDREDAEAIPWLARHSRDPFPRRIVWLQDDVTERRLYWLAVDEPRAGARVVVERQGQVVTVVESRDVGALRVRLNDELLDLDQDVTVVREGTPRFRGRAERTVATLARTLLERGDPRGMSSAELVVE